MENYRDCAKAILELNPRLKAYRRKTLTVFWLKFAIIELLVIAATVYMVGYGVKIAPVLGVVLALVLPFLLLKPQKFFGTRKMGRITKIHHDRRQVYNPMGHTYTELRGATVLDCSVETPSGRVSHFELPKMYQKIYHEGDEVIGLSGIPYPIVLTSHDWILCPYCGGIMQAVNETCVECGAEKIQVLENQENE